jgi:hypothetical protein
MQNIESILVKIGHFSSSQAEHTNDIHAPIVVYYQVPNFLHKPLCSP